MGEGPVDDLDQLFEWERFWKQLVVPVLIPNFLQHFVDITGDENIRNPGPSHRMQCANDTPLKPGIFTTAKSKLYCPSSCNAQSASAPLAMAVTS